MLNLLEGVFDLVEGERKRLEDEGELEEGDDMTCLRVCLTWWRARCWRASGSARRS